MFENYEITIDSFGSDLPSNWQEIAAYLNIKISEIEDTEDNMHDAVNEIWEKYWHGDYDDAPIASEEPY